jgi:hypothetical protein
MSRKRISMDETARRLSRSLAPNLFGSTMWNAVAISFFNPAMGLQKSMETAQAIDELRKVTTRRSGSPPKKKKKKKKTSKRTRRRRQRG